MRLAIGLAAALIALVASCSKQPDETPVVATVSGHPISRGLFAYYVHQKSGVAVEDINPVLRASLLKDLRRLEAAALLGAAEQNAETVQTIELSRLELLARSAATAAGVYAAVTDNELRAEYRRLLTSQSASEYRIAHILMATDAIAMGVVRRLDEGADFAKLARAESADDTKWKGGELGWVHPGHLPPEFMAAVKGLKVGQYTERPIKTPYGWHVIKLLEARTANVPSFEDLKAQLISNVQQARNLQFLDRTLDNAR